MKKQEELVIITKTYDLILWSCKHTGRFPKQHNVGFPLGDAGEKKFNWASELSTRNKNSSSHSFAASCFPFVCSDLLRFTAFTSRIQTSPCMSPI